MNAPVLSATNAGRPMEIGIEGMTCASCVRRVENALRAVPGVSAAAVNLATERATVAGNGADFAALASAVSAAGYTAIDLAPKAAAAGQAARKADETARLLRDLVLAAVLTVPVLVLGMGLDWLPGLHDWVMERTGMGPLNLAQFALATVVLFGPGRRFFRLGVPALLRLAPDMNALVALGTTAAYAYSTVVTFFPRVLPLESRFTYFESAAVIVTLILLGRYLEARAKGRTGAAVARLIGLQAKSARLARGGATIEVALGEVVRGDRVVIRPGDRIPVDGTVITGSSYVDKSMISGEPAPVAKGVGATVIGGTINRNGSFTFTATSVGGETMLAEIVRMVETAQGAKLPIQATVDRVTQWFVPLVIAAAALTFFVWLALGADMALAQALTNAVAVLIVACPCAMGLATPTSIVVGTGRAAEFGILFRKGEALERLRGVTTIAFDKTGTLTLGRPELTEIHLAAGVAEADVLPLIAAAEAGSEHPIGDAIGRYAQGRGAAVVAAEAFEAKPGEGVHARVGGRTVDVGAARYLAAIGSDFSAFGTLAERLAGEGKSPIYAAIDGRAVAVLAVSDPPKASAAAAVAGLRATGLRVVMITGDNAATAAAVARSLGIDEVVADVLPAGKMAAIAALKAGSSGLVAFVGDGVNDAPALATADVGIAVASGTDVAIESADVVLLGSDLATVGRAIAISRATLRNIRENLFWAFGYNVVLIPVAAGILYPFGGPLLSPMLAGGAMALSSVFVVGNALRLRAFGRRRSPAARTAPIVQGASLS